MLTQKQPKPVTSDITALTPTALRARAGRHSGASTKKARVTFADGGDADVKPAPGTTPRPPPGSPPPPPPPPSRATPDPTADAGPIRSWPRVAKEIQTALRDAALGHGCKWPCCQRFLTGKCGDDCRTCARAGKPQRGDQPAREVAAKALARLVKAGRLTTECAEQIRAGESERA